MQALRWLSCLALPLRTHLVIEQLGLLDHHPHFRRDVSDTFMLEFDRIPLRKPTPFRVGLFAEEDGSSVDHGFEGLLDGDNLRMSWNSVWDGVKASLEECKRPNLLRSLEPCCLCDDRCLPMTKHRRDLRLLVHRSVVLLIKVLAEQSFSFSTTERMPKLLGRPSLDVPLLSKHKTKLS